MDPIDAKDKRFLSENVYTVTAYGWVWFFRKDKPKYKITGKYLFFSPNTQRLIDIAVEELENNGFHHAKINPPERRIGGDDVLCLYYKDDSRKQELADKYRDAPDIRYRYWKSDEDTMEGKYSKQYKTNLKEWKPKA